MLLSLFLIFVYYLFAISYIFYYSFSYFYMYYCIQRDRNWPYWSLRMPIDRIRNGHLVADQKITDVGYNGLARGARFHDWTRRLLALQKINIFRVRFLFRGAMIEITLSRLCFPSFSRYVTAAPSRRQMRIFGVAAADSQVGTHGLDSYPH